MEIETRLRDIIERYQRISEQLDGYLEECSDKGIDPDCELIAMMTAYIDKLCEALRELSRSHKLSNISLDALIERERAASARARESEPWEDGATRRKLVADFYN